MIEPAKPKLMWLVRSKIRAMHYSYKTEQSYAGWIKRYIHFHYLTHPKDMGALHVNEFLTHLAVNRHVSPATQNQALCALIFLYKRVLEIPLGENSIAAVRAKYHKNLPVILSTSEIKKILDKLNGLPKLMAQIIYGTGLRKTEVHRLRVKDIDFDRNQISVRRGKGAKDRPLPLPQSCKEDLKHQVEFVEQLFQKKRVLQLGLKSAIFKRN